MKNLTQDELCEYDFEFHILSTQWKYNKILGDDIFGHQLHVNTQSYSKMKSIISLSKNSEN